LRGEGEGGEVDPHPSKKTGTVDSRGEKGKGGSTDFLAKHGDCPQRKKKGKKGGGSAACPGLNYALGEKGGGRSSPFVFLLDTFRRRSWGGRKGGGDGHNDSLAKGEGGAVGAFVCPNWKKGKKEKKNFEGFHREASEKKEKSRWI